MATGRGFTEFLQVEGIIAAIYVAVILCLVWARRARERRAHTLVTAWLAHKRAQVMCVCPRCWGEVTQLYGINGFGPACFVCCANFALASEQNVNDIIPAKRTENNECL